jgi:hypothetical protein
MFARCLPPILTIRWGSEEADAALFHRPLAPASLRHKETLGSVAQEAQAALTNPDVVRRLALQKELAAASFY